MSKSSNEPSIPRSVRQKRILDLAADNPDASFEDLAREVPSVTRDLVERILDEYGDPATDEAETTPEPADPTMAEESDDFELEALSEKQQEVLRAIYEHPDASQRELATVLDVTAATISNRANSIEGFDWENRHGFVKSVFTTETTMRENDSTAIPDEEHNGSRSVTSQLGERITALEREVDALSECRLTTEFHDADLAHKVARACMESDSITDDEELEIFRALLR